MTIDEIVSAKAAQEFETRVKNAMERAALELSVILGSDRAAEFVSSLNSPEWAASVEAAAAKHAAAYAQRFVNQVLP